jgi:hypothetical protein
MEFTFGILFYAVHVYTNVLSCMTIQGNLVRKSYHNIGAFYILFYRSHIVGDFEVP